MHATGTVRLAFPTAVNEEKLMLIAAPLNTKCGSIQWRNLKRQNDLSIPFSENMVVEQDVAWFICLAPRPPIFPFVRMANDKAAMITEHHSREIDAREKHHQSDCVEW